jgi:hypothetical protein
MLSFSKIISNIPYSSSHTKIIQPKKLNLLDRSQKGLQLNQRFL